MKKFLALAVLALFAGCAGHEVNPDAAKSRIAGDPHCLHDTGSSVPRTPDDCRALGRAYTPEELGQTGRPGLGDGIKDIVPR